MPAAPTPVSSPSHNGRLSPWVAFCADALMALGLVLLLGIAAALILAMLKGGEGSTAPSAIAQMMMAIVSTGGAAVTVYLVRCRASETEKHAAVAALYRLSTWGWAVMAGVLVFAGSNLLGWLFDYFTAMPAPSNLDLMRHALQQQPLFLMVFAVVLAPFYEELLFRRVLFGRLARAGHVAAGVVLSSLLFALSHEIPGLSMNGWTGTLQLWLVYGGMGAVFAWVYQRTGTLFAAVLAHAINNGLALLLLWAGTQAV